MGSLLAHWQHLPQQRSLLFVSFLLHSKMIQDWPERMGMKSFSSISAAWVLAAILVLVRVSCAVQKSAILIKDGGLLHEQKCRVGTAHQESVETAKNSLAPASGERVRVRGPSCACSLLG